MGFDLLMLLFGAKAHFLSDLCKRLVGAGVTAFYPGLRQYKIALATRIPVIIVAPLPTVHILLYEDTVTGDLQLQVVVEVQLQP